MAEQMEKPFFEGIIVVKRLSAIGLALVRFKDCSRFVFTQSQWIKIRIHPQPIMKMLVIRVLHVLILMIVQKICLNCPGRLGQMAEQLENPFFKGIIIVKQLSGIGQALVWFKEIAIFVGIQTHFLSEF